LGKKNKGNDLARVSNHKELKIKRTLIAAQRFSGPIPPADEFRKYGEVLSDAPERIFAVFEAESKTAREDRSFALRAEVKRDARAQWMSFGIMIAAMAMTTLAIMFGRNIAPAIITGLATLFLALKVLFPTNNTAKKKNSEQD